VADPSPEAERLAILVHEVRSPVAALTAILETFDHHRLDQGSLLQLVHLAVAASRSIRRIVEDASPGTLRLAAVDVAGVARDAVAAAVLEGGAVRVRVEESPQSITGDVVRLRQALDNLIRNALVHSGSDAEVVVRVRDDGGAVLLSVADAGRGIPDADRERVIEPGVQLEPSRGGSGLGLAVVRAIAEAHGGSLSVVSQMGGGATFTIALPVAEPGAAGVR
jgi:signal transduction histidine kinase